ncbi:DUF92 domain-containing protein [Neobacillus kokaensis]|uniref:DUF92 domain-containing protein n=1 Tax=Neobacillus kokaensis TaxID=2759023 RepID=A0ABQ3MWD3_9BACI|nr:DUF92 domain-containing protein [Neobacillus kokaensis]GHH96995.1 hypothetical protein AM1BK_05380 [Neobacillus kokaensis]
MLDSVLMGVIMLLLGYAGYRTKSLSKSGAIAAAVVGYAIYLGFHFKGLLILGVFFATSSYWSKYKSEAKEKMEEKLAKGGARDWRQVFANGGAAALFSILYYFDNSPIWLIGFVVSLASANSDTWASEIGSLSKKAPLCIRTFKRVEKGTSGAVSGLGTIAALLGSLLISLISVWIFNFDLLLGSIVFLFGFFGNVVDTLVGAFYQQLFRCKKCGFETEKRMHCGQPTMRIKGISFIENDMVNFLSGLISAIIAMWVFHFFFPL